MTVYEFGMKMEKDGEAFYREMAGKTKDTGMRNILTMLAEDEVKHCATLDGFRREEKTGFADSKILEGARNIFEKCRETSEEWNLQGEQIDLYEKAKGLEQQSAEFYLAKAEEVGNAYQKEIFLKIAEEEKKHVFLLENMIQFIGRPKSWIENAEFYHLDDY